MKEAGNVPMLLQSSESAESSCSAVTKKKKLASMFIPTSSNRSFDYENQHVRQADSPQGVKKNPTVTITMRGLLTEKNNKEIEMTKCPKEPEYRLSTGPLGMCDNDYCMICPTYCRQKKKEMQDNNRRYQRQQHVNQKFHDVQDGEPKRGTRKLLLFIHQFIPGVVNPHSKFVYWWDRVFLTSCCLATFVDPLFFFLLSVHQENKCIVLNWTLAWVIMVIRSSTDLVYLLHMLLQFRLAYISPEPRAVVGFGVLIVHPKKIILNYLLRCFWIDLVVVLPLPQIMTLLVQTTLLLTSATDTKNVLRYIVLFQYIPRLWRFLPILTGRSPNGLLFETAWAHFVINLFSFVLAGHVVGSTWYLLGLQRVNQCLKEACDASHLGTNYIGGCKKLIDCGHVSKINKDAITNPELWRNYTGAISCFTADGFSYGIYLQAVNLTNTKRNSVIRYTYSLFWGFQQISTLAGNQTPSYFIWEVLFTMAIVGLGLLLFALLIGNMQNFLQALGRRRLDMMLRQRDFEQWMSHRRLPKEIKEKIRNAEKYHWMANRGVDEEKLMVNLPEDLQTEIRQYLFKFLKNVRIFHDMDPSVLDAISERLRQKTYISGCQILFPRGPIKRMTFIVHGEMKSITEDRSVAHLSAGDVCGEELLTWCLKESAGNQETTLQITKERPVSNRTVRCVTNVEAFVLGAADLEEVTCLFAKCLTTPRVQKAIRFEKESLAARRIQAAWRNKKERQVQSKTAGISDHLILPFQKDAGSHSRL